MKYPTNSNELRSAGFTYAEDGRCRGKNCHEPIEWWITPGGKRIPMSKVIVGTLEAGDRREMLEPHFAKCPDVGDFRRPS
jgi:hypothetical protein